MHQGKTYLDEFNCNETDVSFNKKVILNNMTIQYREVHFDNLPNP